MLTPQLQQFQKDAPHSAAVLFYLDTIIKASSYINPIEEHAKHSPSCPYVLFLSGKQRTITSIHNPEPIIFFTKV